jgi:hypothetical protein
MINFACWPIWSKPPPVKVVAWLDAEITLRFQRTQYDPE